MGGHSHHPHPCWGGGLRRVVTNSCPPMRRCERLIDDWTPTPHLIAYDHPNPNDSTRGRSHRPALASPSQQGGNWGRPEPTHPLWPPTPNDSTGPSSLRLSEQGGIEIDRTYSMCLRQPDRYSIPRRATQLPNEPPNSPTTLRGAARTSPPPFPSPNKGKLRQTRSA